MAAFSLLPLEVEHHVLTFAAIPDIAALLCCSRFLERIAGHDDLWALLLARDFPWRNHYALAERDRSLRDVYQMTKTRRYKERSFDERPLAQKAAIVLTSVVLSPIIFIYLTPRIVRGLHRSVWQPSVDLWLDIARQQELLCRPAVDPATRSWAYLRRQPPRPKFKDLPWSQKLGVILTSAPMSPFLALLYVRRFLWKTLPRIVTRGAKWIHARVLRPLLYTVLLPTLRWVRVQWVRTLAAFQARVVQPLVAVTMRSLAEMHRACTWVNRQVLEPSGRASCKAWATSKAFTYHRILCPLGTASMKGARRCRDVTCELWDVTRACCSAGGSAIGDVWRLLLQHVVRPTLDGIRLVAIAVLRRVRTATVTAARTASRGGRLAWERAVLPALKLLAFSVRFGANTTYQRLLSPLGRGIRRAAIALGRALVVTADALRRHVLLPVGRAAMKGGRLMVEGTVYFLRMLALGVRLGAALTYDKVLLPMGRGLWWAGALFCNCVALPTLRAAMETGETTIHSATVFLQTLALGVRLGAAFTYEKVLMPAGRGLRLVVVMTPALATRTGQTCVVVVVQPLQAAIIGSWAVIHQTALDVACQAVDVAVFIRTVVLVPAGRAVHRGAVIGMGAASATASLLTVHILLPAAAVAAAAANAAVDSGCSVMCAVQSLVVYPAMGCLVAIEESAVRISQQCWCAMCDFFTWVSRAPQASHAP